MKLYVMANGIAPDMPKEALVSTGKPIDPKDIVPIPIMTFLIEHPAGLILFDTGWSKPDRWPRHWDIAEDEQVLNRLKKLGIYPRDIKYLICSHLHIDHAGGLEDFPESEILVSDAELTNVAKLYFLNQLSHPYVRADVEAWIRIGLKWRLIDNKETIIDFLDGVHILSFGSGHSFGMLGLLIELANTGNIIITSDAIYCKENAGPPIRLPGIIYDPEGYRRTLNKILEIAKKYNAKLWYGHDMEQFNRLVKSDKGYYD